MTALAFFGGCGVVIVAGVLLLRHLNGRPLF